MRMGDMNEPYRLCIDPTSLKPCKSAFFLLIDVCDGTRTELMFSWSTCTIYHLMEVDV